jgi:hypothetical protein
MILRTCGECGRMRSTGQDERRRFDVLERQPATIDRLERHRTTRVPGVGIAVQGQLDL